MDSSKNQVHFGDLIVLIGQKATENGVLRGSLAGLGFLDNRLFFQQLPQAAVSSAIKEVMNKLQRTQNSSLNFIDNYNDMVFQIHPQLNYEANKDYKKLLKETEQLRQLLNDEQQKQNIVEAQSSQVSPRKTQQSLVRSNKENEEQANKSKTKELLKQSEEKLAILKRRAKIEHKQNLEAIDRYHSQPVCYGNPIFLMHYPSKMFLTGRVEGSDAQMDAYQFELSSSFQSGMTFRFQPKFKLRQRGDSVQYGDSLIILNEKLEGYINFSTDKITDIDNLSNIPEPTQKLTELTPVYLRQPNPKTPRFNAYLSLSSDVHWQLFRHGPPVVQENQIRGGDIIRIRHTEIGSCLSADRPYTGVLQEIYIRKYYGDFKQEIDSLNSMWIIEVDRSFSKGDELYSEKNGEVCQFILRHLLTGKLLGVQPVQIGSTKFDSLILLGDKADPRSTQAIKFHPTIRHPVQILRGQSSYKIQFGQSYLQTQITGADEDGKISYLGYEVKQPLLVPHLYQGLTDEELKLQRISICLKPVSSDQDTFWIEKVSEDEHNIAGSIISALPSLQRLLKYIKTGNKDLVQSEVLRPGIKVLQSMVDFVNDQEKQKMMKQAYVLDLLTQLIYYAFETQLLIPSQFKQAPQDLLKVMSLSYKLIKRIIREYRPNELFMSQWISLLMEQAMYEDPYYDIGAGEALTELIDNNQLVLETKIHPEMIQLFVEEVLRVHDVKYLNLMRALVNCDGSAMVASQNEISLKLLTEENLNLLIPKIIFDGFDVKVDFNGDFVELELYDHTSSVNDNGKSYQFLKTLIFFLADLCLDKNFTAILRLQPVLSFQMCSHIIRSEKYDLSIRSAFIQLFVNLWVEGEKYQKLQLPDFVRTWEELNSFTLPKLLCCEDDIKIYTELKEFINLYFKIEGDRGYSRVFAMEENQFTLQVVKLCKIFTEYGFYQTSQEIREYLSPLLKMLEGINDVMTTDEERLRKQGSSVKKRSALRTQTTFQYKQQAQAKKRYTSTQESKILMDVRTEINSLLIFIEQLMIDQKATVFLKCFRADIDRRNKNDTSFSHMLDLNAHSPLGLETSKLPLKMVASNEHVNLREDKQYSLKWIEQAVIQMDISIPSLSRLDLFAIQADLMMYESPRLVNSSFDVLVQLFSKRKQLYDYLKSIQIIEDDAKMRILKLTTKAQKELMKQVDASETWWGLDRDNEDALNQATTFSDQLRTLSVILFDGAEIELQDNFSNMQDQNEMSALLRDVDKMVESSMFSRQTDRVGRDNIMLDQSSLDEHSVRKRIKPEFQKLMRNLEVHVPVIKLIQYDLGVEVDDTPTRSLVLQRCYRFLTFFCFDNQLNKDLLLPYLKDFRVHLIKSKESLSYLIFQEIFRNNRIILSDEKGVVTTIKGICQILKGLDFSDKLKIHLLDSLKIYMKKDDTFIKPNQTAVLTFLGLNSDKLMILLNTDDQLRRFAKQSEEIKLEFQKALDDEPHDEHVVNFNEHELFVFIPLDVEYFLVQMNLLSFSSSERNAANESKCQTYFPLDKLYRILQNCEGNYVLRKEIFYFFFNVYVESEKDRYEQMDYYIMILEMACDDFCVISEQNLKLFNPRVTIKSLKNTCNARKFFQEYMTQVLMPTIQLSMKMNVIPYNKIEEYYTKIIAGIFKLSTCQSQTVTYQASKLLVQIRKNRRICNIVDYYGKWNDELPSIIKNMISQIIQQGGKLTYKRRIMKDPSMDDPESLYYKFNKRIEELNNDNFSKAVEKEIQEFVHNLLHVQQLTQTAFKTASIKFDEIFHKLVDMADPVGDPLAPPLQKVILNVFRKMIERECPNTNGPAAEWSNDDYAQYTDKITEAQDIIVNLDVAQVICSLIIEDGIQNDLRRDAILTGCTLLLGGNLNSQAKILEQLMKDEKNAFIHNIKQMIEDNMTLAKKALDRINKIKERQIRSARIKLPTEASPQEASQEDSDQSDSEPGDQVGQSPDVTFRPVQKQLQPPKTPWSERGKDDEIDPGLVLQPYEQSALDDLKLIFRFLQLLCEGHNLSLQNYLREQRQNDRINGLNTNMIQFSCNMLIQALKWLNLNSAPFVSQLLDFLIESIQGPCPENQQSLINAKVIYACRDTLQMFLKDLDYLLRGFTDKAIADEIVSKSTKLLVSLIEGNTTIEISKSLSDTLEMNFIRQKLTEVYVRFCEFLNASTKEDVSEINSIAQKRMHEFPQFLEEAFSMYILLQNLAFALKGTSYQNYAQMLLESESTKEIENKAMRFFSTNCANIEVNFNGKLFKVFFPVQPSCHNLSKASRAQFMEDVKRDNPSEKLSGLMNEMGIFFVEMDHLTYLNTLQFKFTSKRLSLLQDICTLLSFLINIVMLYAYERQSQINVTQVVIDEINEQLINALGLVQLVFVLLMIIYWIIINAPVIIKRQWVLWNRENRPLKSKDTDKQLKLYDSNAALMPTKMVRYVLDTRGPYSPFFEEGYQGFTKWLYYGKCVVFLIGDPGFVYMVLYTVISVCGYVIFEIYYCLQLFDVVRRSPMLQNVTKSVTQNWKSLVLTLFLIMIAIFIHSLILYMFIPEAAYNTTHYNVCNSAMQCFLYTFKFGFTAGGGVHDIISNPSYESNFVQTYYIWLVLDLSFFILITILLLNILFGIIIDTFAELRDQKKERMEDMRTKCFICGTDRYVFEKNADGFKQHIERDHQLWNYLYYVYYIQHKDQTDLNGIESYVTEKINELSLDWFPVMKSLSLEGKEVESDSLVDKADPHFQNIYGQISRLQGLAASLRERFNKDE